MMQSTTRTAAEAAILAAYRQLSPARQEALAVALAVLTASENTTNDSTDGAASAVTRRD